MVLEKPASAGFFSTAEKPGKSPIAKRLHAVAAFSSFSKSPVGLIYVHPLSTGSAWGHG